MLQYLYSFSIINMTSSISCKRFMEKINDDDDDYEFCMIFGIKSNYFHEKY